jgi:hypothetical protein
MKGSLWRKIAAIHNSKMCGFSATDGFKPEFID